LQRYLKISNKQQNMEKKFYFLFLAMMVSFVVSAQRFEYQLGLKGGLGVDWIGKVEEDVLNKDNGLCYKFGFTGVYYFKENYGITSGFNIIGNKAGYKYKLTDDSEAVPQEKEFKVDYKNTYCQIPILLKMRTDAFASKYRVLGEIGYGLDILVDGEYKLDGAKQPNRYRDVCSSFIVHLGLEVEVLKRSTLQFIIAYDNIFTNMSSSDNRLTMNNLCLEIGFLF